MSFITNTMADANAPATLYSLIDPLLTTNGYTLVDTVVISTRTHKIYKNPAANNPTGKDWYLDVAYTTTGTGTLGFYVYEGYNPATDSAIGPAYSALNTTFTNNGTGVYSRFGVTETTLENANMSPKAGGTAPYNRDMTIPATSFGYWISVSSARVVSLVSTNATEVFYTGAYAPSTQAAATNGSNGFPLVSIRIVSGNSANRGDGAATRLLYGMTSVYTVNGYGWSQVMYAQASAAIQYFGAGAPVPSGTLLYGSNYLPKIATPIPLSTASSTTGEYGTYWGNLIDCYVMAADASVARGDTVTISGVTWVCASASGGYATIFKAA